jgi:transposase
MDKPVEAPEPTLEDRAARINQEYLAILTEEQRGNRGIVERAARVGKDLLDLKSKVGHGNWVKWVKANCPQISKSTVERWMKLAENKSKIEAEMKTRRDKNSTVTFLTLRQALVIANAKEGKSTPPVRKRFTRAMEQLVDLLPEFESVESAEEYVSKARERLDDTLTSMRKEKAA